MSNEAIDSFMKQLDGGKRDDLLERLGILVDQRKQLSHEKAKKIGLLMYAISTSFATGAVILTENGIKDSLNKKTISKENAELSLILLRQMFSARDGESSKGKQNYQLLQDLLKAIYYPSDTFKGDFTCVLIQELNKNPLYDKLARTIKSAMDSRKKGAIICAVLEYYTPMFIAALSYSYFFGLNDKQKRIKNVNTKKDSTLYLDYHSNTEEVHLGYHVFRTLLRDSEYDRAREYASELISLFIEVIDDIEKTLPIRIGSQKM